MHDPVTPRQQADVRFNTAALMEVSADSAARLGAVIPRHLTNAWRVTFNQSDPNPFPRIRWWR